MTIFPVFMVFWFYITSILLWETETDFRRSWKKTLNILQNSWEITCHGGLNLEFLQKKSSLVSFYLDFVKYFKTVAL